MHRFLDLWLRPPQSLDELARAVLDSSTASVEADSDEALALEHFLKIASVRLAQAYLKEIDVPNCGITGDLPQFLATFGLRVEEHEAWPFVDAHELADALRINTGLLQMINDAAVERNPFHQAVADSLASFFRKFSNESTASRLRLAKEMLQHLAKHVRLALAKAPQHYVLEFRETRYDTKRIWVQVSGEQAHQFDTIWRKAYTEHPHTPGEVFAHIRKTYPKLRFEAPQTYELENISRCGFHLYRALPD